MKKYIQVVTTTDTEKSAEKITATLIENRLAACVQIIGPINSIYWWKATVERAVEWLCIIKTRQDLYSSVESSIKAIHGYKVPEIIALPILKGYKDYLSWMEEELRK